MTQNREMTNKEIALEITKAWLGEKSTTSCAPSYVCEGYAAFMEQLRKEDEKNGTHARVLGSAKG